MTTPRPIATKVIKDPITGNHIRVPAHYLAEPRARGDMRQCLEVKGYGNA